MGLRQNPAEIVFGAFYPENHTSSGYDFNEHLNTTSGCTKVKDDRRQTDR